MSANSRFNAFFLLILLSLIWGTSFILIKYGLKVYSPDEVSALRISAASLVMLPFALVRLKQLKKGHFPKLLIAGSLGILIPAFLFPVAQKHMNSSMAGILNTLTPFFTMLIGSIFFSQKFRPAVIIGILLGLVGAIILMLSRSGGVITGINNYALLIVAACILYAMNINFTKYKISDLSSLTITSVSLMLIGPLSLTYLFGFSDFTVKLLHNENAWSACGLIVLLGVMSTSIAMVIFNKLVKISTPLFTSFSTYIIPMVAVMWGLMDGEALQLTHYLGMVTILTGVYLANRKKGNGKE